MLLKGMTMDYKEKLAERYYDKNPSEFKKDALSFYGLENHPKADLLHHLCYEEGHSHGYENVDYYLSEFSELLKD